MFLVTLKWKNSAAGLARARIHADGVTNGIILKGWIDKATRCRGTPSIRRPHFLVRRTGKNLRAHQLVGHPCVLEPDVVMKSAWMVPSAAILVTDAPRGTSLFIVIRPHNDCESYLFKIAHGRSHLRLYLGFGQ